ncbi:MsnO8 family LLM class oxidoreductase [Actinocorallia herbida]|uniref:MsnO8 family LLM class oxidoreductase n=1 Tax=Actinocorallia herbida TaxID=58109 RepID=UPI001B880A64|nr:MsnO8 family LLM class oxidoreductase [Actinocorallia herbida]
MSVPLRLSVLDQSPLTGDAGPADALARSLDLARQADSLGFHRVWFAGHHRSGSFAGTSPETMAAPALERTSRIRAGSGRVGSGRVGSGGILLPRHRPDKVAETMGILAFVHPGRVDVGIGRGGGPAADFDRKVSDLRGLLLDAAAGSADPGEPAAHLWLLGAGGSSAPLAGSLGAGYAFGHFFAPSRGRAVLAGYRAHLPSGAARGGPLLAVRAVAAADPERAAALARAMLLWRARKDLGTDAPVPSLAALDRHV